MKTDLKRFIKIFRFKWSITIVFVLVGALVGSEFHLSSINLTRLILTLVLFQVWYLAIYVIADIIDYEADLADHIKSSRPLPSGLVSKSQALASATIVLVITGSLSYLLAPKLLLFELAFLLYNLLYSTYLKHIVYIDSFSNAATTAARAYMGMALFGGHVYVPIIISCYLLALGVAVAKRLNEKRRKQVGRATSSGYSFLVGNMLFALVIIGNFILCFTTPPPYRSIPIIIFCLECLLLYCFYSKNKYFSQAVKLF